MASTTETGSILGIISFTVIVLVLIVFAYVNGVFNGISRLTASAGFLALLAIILNSVFASRSSTWTLSSKVTMIWSILGCVGLLSIALGVGIYYTYKDDLTSMREYSQIMLPVSILISVIAGSIVIMQKLTLP
jgi:hypothetical protein